MRGLHELRVWLLCQALREEVSLEPCQEGTRSDRMSKLPLFPYRTRFRVMPQQRGVAYQLCGALRAGGAELFLLDAGLCFAQRG
ncbi:hypothetical protein [Candidatus Methylacidithermus pantelleriae]|uniref:Uncharacterized protein n=1 Tax=Candidatus Methylacidithermus pantelleriae TaxID=2744239 RepID=A0A8J2BPH9_9BACT|nr:hypothetical protein [Candidatus Methylacidithermus pantelleriae]CAF0699060.1 hypothetical protein MPNT_30111 [Candidatus Methylacidithermus pantelleriae]